VHWIKNDYGFYEPDSIPPQQNPSAQQNSANNAQISPENDNQSINCSILRPKTENDAKMICIFKI